jgi:hypothetical protein
MDKRIAIPRMVVRPILPPPLEIGARIRPQWLNWQVGRYREKLSFGPGGKGKADIWVPEREGEQHNLILTQLYDTLIPTYGFIGSSQYAAVGTGSTAPDPSQTQLVNEIGTSGSPRRTNSVPSGESNEIEALATYGEYNIRRVFEFTEAQVGGLNLTEWGFSPVNTYNGPLMTRELFRDGSGNPVVLTLATDQRLRLIYRYKVTVSPTSAQNVSVNIGGDGPGIRTARFVLTGMFSTYDPSFNAYFGVNYFGIALNSFDSTFRQRRGDLIVADALARGTTFQGAGVVVANSSALPLNYIHTTEFASGAAKSLNFAAASGRSRQASVLFNTNEAVMTIRSVVIGANIRTTNPNSSTANLVFDNGQEFTKDNLHKLLIAYWQVTWGP